ncbi:MAG TPA: 50S ribosomal protein L6 [Acidimicrobiia bacterium]|nr:50S ribosomal protein L6 [Acidimicrobiia bacterium]
MSRIGRKPIPIPAGVEVSFNGTHVTVKGPKGTLERDLVPDIAVTREGDELIVTRPTDQREHRALHGLTRSLVSNMVVGVSEGFAKDLEIVGVGYRATAQGPNKIELALGFSHPVHVDAPEGITFEVPAPTRITVRGSNKELVGQVAANIRKIRKPEPYKGTGVRSAGERILRKAG